MCTQQWGPNHKPEPEMYSQRPVNSYRMTRLTSHRERNIIPLGFLLMNSSVITVAYRALPICIPFPATEQHKPQHGYQKILLHRPSMLTAFDITSFPSTKCSHGHAQKPAHCALKASYRPQLRLGHYRSHHHRRQRSYKGRRTRHAEADAGQPHARTASSLSTVCDVLVLLKVMIASGGLLKYLLLIEISCDQ